MKNVVVTMGAEGSAYVGGGKYVRVDSFKAEAVDTTGGRGHLRRRFGDAPFLGRGYRGSDDVCQQSLGDHRHAAGRAAVYPLRREVEQN